MCTAAHHHRTPAHMCTTSPTSPWYVGHELAARCSCVVCGQQGAYGCPGQGTTPSRAHDYAQVAAAMLAAARRLAAPPVVMPCPGGTGPLAHYGGRPCCPAPPVHDTRSTAPGHCHDCGYPLPHGPAAAALCRGLARGTTPHLYRAGQHGTLLAVHRSGTPWRSGTKCAGLCGYVRRSTASAHLRPWQARTVAGRTTWHRTLRGALRHLVAVAALPPAPALCWPPAPLPAHWPLYAAGGRTLALSRTTARHNLRAAGVQA